MIWRECPYPTFLVSPRFSCLGSGSQYNVAQVVSPVTDPQGVGHVSQ